MLYDCITFPVTTYVVALIVRCNSIAFKANAQVTASILTGIVISTKVKILCFVRLENVHVDASHVANNPASVFVCLHSYCAQTAQKKEGKKKRKRGCAADPRRDNLSHKTGVDINTPFTIDEITFQKKNATRVMR